MTQWNAEDSESECNLARRSMSYAFTGIMALILSRIWDRSIARGTVVQHLFSLFASYGGDLKSKTEERDFQNGTTRNRGMAVARWCYE